VENSIFEKVEEAETLRVQLDDARLKAEEESHEAAFQDVLAGGLAEVHANNTLRCLYASIVLCLRLNTTMP
jgi:hypothetical protein